jgi:hypothetical protein
MKIFETEMVEQEVLKRKVCNRCGKDNDEWSNIETLKFCYGYGSDNDGQIDEFELCEDCFAEIAKTFKLMPTRYDAIYRI